MCTFVPENQKESPDRADALVRAISELNTRSSAVSRPQSLRGRRLKAAHVAHLPPVVQRAIGPVRLIESVNRHDDVRKCDLPRYLIASDPGSAT